MLTTLLIATRNEHKVGEIRAILGAPFCCRTLRDCPGAPVTIEDAPTFAGNAAKKALELAAYAAANPGPGVPDFVLADDSGLEVDALDGAPGVHSARFAAGSQTGNSPDAANNAKLLRLLAEVPSERRTARFRCVIALVPLRGVTPNSAPQIFDGDCEGRIQFAAAGLGGFGYDPLFIPNGFTQSFAELGEDVKNRLSHRARALEKLQRALLGRMSD